MCETNADFTTITGPRNAVKWLATYWEGEGFGRLGIRSVTFDDLADYDGHYADNDSPAVAVALHEPGDGPRVAALLSAELMTRHTASFTSLLMCEPGHYFTGEGGGGSAGSGSGSLLDRDQISRAVPLVPSLPKAAGRRVALLDTGDANSLHAMTDLTGATLRANVKAADPHGHGTAVAEAIVAVASHADIE